MLGQILAELSRIISVRGTIVGIVTGIQGSRTKAAQENSPFEIDTAQPEVIAIVEDGTFGNQALHDMIVANQAALTSQLDDIEVQIGTPQQAGVPVTPPVGQVVIVSDVSSSDIVNGVWSKITPQGADTLDAVGNAYLLSQFWGQGGTRMLAGVPWLTWFSLDAFAGLDQLTIQPPAILDETTILSTDADLQAWLNRVSAPALWATHAYFGFDGLYYPDQVNAAITLWCTITPGQFAGFQAPLVAVRVPPVCPGIDKHSFLPHVAIDVSVRIDVPMDGCLVYIDSVPSKTGFFTFGDQISYRNIGAVAFINDDLDVEVPQLIGPQDALNMPTALQHASDAVFRFSTD